MTICFALFLGLGSKQAAKFSFLLAIPVISGAGLLMAIDMNDGFNMDVSTSLAGLVTSFFVGFISSKALNSVRKCPKVTSAPVFPGSLTRSQNVSAQGPVFI